MPTQVKDIRAQTPSIRIETGPDRFTGIVQTRLIVAGTRLTDDEERELAVYLLRKHGESLGMAAGVRGRTAGQSLSAVD